MTPAEARWRAQRMQHLLDNGMERFEAMALVRQESKSTPWITAQTIATSAVKQAPVANFKDRA